MAVQNVRHATTILSREDLTGAGPQYHAIALNDGKLANSGGEASGVLLNKPQLNNHASLGYVGELKFHAGGAIGAGEPITVATSGWFTKAASDSYVVGRCKVAVTSGSYGTGLFNFIAPVYAMSSSFCWA